jgi:hypothetical protein
MGTKSQCITVVPIVPWSSGVLGVKAEIDLIFAILLLILTRQLNSSFRP